MKLAIFILAFVAIASAQEKVKVAKPDYKVKVVENAAPDLGTGQIVDPAFYRPSVGPGYVPISFGPAIVQNRPNSQGGNAYPYRPNDGIARSGNK